MNDVPVRTAGTLTAITVDEDSANTTAVTLGLSAVTYGPGGGADEASQTLTYTIGTIPSYVQMFKADGTTAVTAASTVTGAELQGLKYKTLANANGTGSVTWTVTDNGSNTPPNANSLSESLSITVNAVNDAPVRHGGHVDGDHGRRGQRQHDGGDAGPEPVTYGPGGGADEASQTLTYTIGTIPSYVQLFKADGTTAVTAGAR